MKSTEFLRTEVFLQAPEDFRFQLEVSACYLCLNHKYLFLQAEQGKLDGGLWGIPCGKLEKGESKEEAVLREVFEETGISLAREGLKAVGKLYVRRPGCDFIFHMFEAFLTTLPTITLSKEHTAFQWLTSDQAFSLPLMPGEDQALLHYRNFTRDKGLDKAFVCVYLILKKGQEVLFHLRKNTGFADGHYSLPAGHVDSGETALQAMLREAYEEAGIRIDAKDLTLKHVMHRRADRVNMDLFFECKHWEGEIENKEPNKCAELAFFSKEAFPGNLLAYVRQALELSDEGVLYSESSD